METPTAPAPQATTGAGTVRRPYANADGVVKENPLRKAPDGKDVICVDTGPLIRQAGGRLAGKGHLFCPPGVIGEIKDKQTMLSLEVQCPDLRTECPTDEDLRYVRDFAHENGNIAHLSGVDLDVAALAVKLTRQFMGSDCLRTEMPEMRKVGKDGRTKGLNSLKLDPQLVRDAKAALKAAQEYSEESSETEEESTPILHTYHGELVDEDAEGDEGEECSEGEYSEAECEAEDSEYYSDSDDEANPWITPDNLHHVGQNIQTTQKKEKAEEDTRTYVYCTTTDYALQNLLLSMGVLLKSVDGFQIRNISVWGQLCRSCNHLNQNSNSKFCQSCGGYMLRRVALNRGPDGEILVTDTRNTSRIITKGMNTSLPKPKKGKAGKFKDEIILCEDQLLTHTMQWRQRKADHERSKMMKLSTDPYAGMGVGTHNKSAEQWETNFQIAMGRGNPNSRRYHDRNAAKKRKS